MAHLYLANAIAHYSFSSQPLFKVSAQEKSLHRLTDEEIDKIKKERPGGYSETEVRITITAVKFQYGLKFPFQFGNINHNHVNAV